jgi:nucleotide-binding universal stress UspA family protein
VDWPAIGQRLWAGLKDYHVLSPTGLKTLICMDQSPAGQAAAEFGLGMAQAASGPATVLAVSNSAEETAEIRERLEALRQTWLPRLPGLETRFRQGNSTIQILLETQEGAYEVVVLGRSSEPSISGSIGLGQTARKVLVQTQRPVLLVPAPRAKLERILICTAAGEPGKADVRFGGRLARQADANASVLHVRSIAATPEQRKRVDRHLRQTEATLISLGLKPEIKMKEGAPVETILRESSEGDYDLIVIGAPSPRAPHEIYWRDLATQVVSGAACPVLVVPMLE